MQTAGYYNCRKKKDPLCIYPEDVFDPNLFVGWGGELAKRKQNLQCLLDYCLRSLNILE